VADKPSEQGDWRRKQGVCARASVRLLALMRHGRRKEIVGGRRRLEDEEWRTFKRKSLINPKVQNFNHANGKVKSSYIM
jgi:hypothetical protein